MSNNVNEQLLEQVGESINLASMLIEYWTGTMNAEVLDLRVAQVTKHVDDNNLDDLYNVSLPSLDEAIKQIYTAMWEIEYNPNEVYRA